MGYLKRFLSLFKTKKVTVSVESPKDCPFCWGYQEYGTTTRIMAQDKQIDVKNHRDKYVKVGKFMVEHVDGFKNKKGIVERCPKCGGKRIRFKETSK